MTLLHRLARRLGLFPARGGAGVGGPSIGRPALPLTPEEALALADEWTYANDGWAKAVTYHYSQRGLMSASQRRSRPPTCATHTSGAIRRSWTTNLARPRPTWQGGPT